MMKVLLVQNITREEPGLVQQILRARNIPFDLVDLHKGQIFPEPAFYNCVFVFGGPDSANDTNEKMVRELAQVKKITDSKIPYLGICLGMQILVKANGGKVLPAEEEEIGWRDQEENYYEIELTNVGRRDPLFENVVSPAKIFQLHKETVGLVQGMQLLATGKHCQNQAVRVGANAYGMQGHLELTPELFERWLTEDMDLSQMDMDSLRHDFESIRTDYETSGRQVITNFLKIAKLL